MVSTKTPVRQSKNLKQRHCQLLVTKYISKFRLETTDYYADNFCESGIPEEHRRVDIFALYGG